MGNQMNTYEDRLNKALKVLEVQARTSKQAKEALENIGVACSNIYTCEDAAGSPEWNWYLAASVNGYIEGERLEDEPYYRDIYAI
tara:strand:+ start:26420 stop:26674 length:255 start_codon:yes stop_codon:yes gene_type:complete